MLKRLNNKTGATLTELIVGMLVLSIVLLAVTSVFLPMYNAHTYANDMAEINALLNSLSSVILSDIESANGIEFDEDEGTLTILVSGTDVLYDTDADPDTARRILRRNDVPVFDAGFYRRMSVAIENGEQNGGVFSFELVVSDRLGEVERREYTARPVGLVGLIP
jgi:Tfp pilus assembly protein PilW